MKDGVYVVSGGKTYRVVSRSRCDRRSCSLFVREVCCSEEWDPDEYPCDGVCELLEKATGVYPETANFEEVKW